MKELSQLQAPAGAKHKKKRVGRGQGCHGKTSGRGHKGQNARSGGSVPPAFEGGQMPLIRRLPKRGFTNIWRTEYAIVNLRELDRFAEDTVVDPDILVQSGLIKRRHGPVKILGQGELQKRLVVHAHKFSKSAQQKIEASGGKTEVLGA